MTQDTDAQHLPAVPTDGECATCGCSFFTLAKDMTAYTPGIYFVDGKPVNEGSTDVQDGGAEESVRLFCTGCGERYAVPEELVE